MKAKELKEALKNVDDDVEIIIFNDDIGRRFDIYDYNETDENFLKTHKGYKKEFVLHI